MSPRRTIAALAALTTVLLLAGCTQAPKEEAAMTPHEARDQLVKTVKDTAARLSIGGWTEDSAPDVGSCDGDVPSVDYGYGYGTAPGTDHLADAQKVADYWKTLGMTVRVETAPDPVVYATGGPVKGLSFSTAPGNYYVSGTSLCVPGDVDALTDEQAG